MSAGEFEKEISRAARSLSATELESLCAGPLCGWIRVRVENGYSVRLGEVSDVEWRENGRCLSFSATAPLVMTSPSGEETQPQRVMIRGAALGPPDGRVVVMMHRVEMHAAEIIKINPAAT